MKKYIAFLLAFLLLTSLVLTACQKDDNLTTEQAETEEPVETESALPEDTDDEFVFDGTFNASCFTAYMEDFTGEVDGETFTGVRMKCTAYQPGTYLTKRAVKALRLYARENNYDALRVHAHIEQTNNMFMIGDKYLPNNEWSVTDINLGNLYTYTQFWSQSESETEDYFWFEFIKLPVINNTSFTNDVTEFSGTVGGETFDGFLFKSDQYQPYAWFQDYAIEDIKAYAEENGFNALRVHVYAIQKDNGFVVAGQYFPLEQWKTVDLSIADMTTETMYLWSQSQGLTENYLWFEFVNSDNPVTPSTKVSGGGSGTSYSNTNPYFTSNMSFSAVAFNGTVEGETFDGFRLRSAEYQPTFYLTQKGIDLIRQQAAAANGNIVRIHAYPILFNNGFVVGSKYTAANTWTVTEIALEDLTTETAFWSQSEGLTDVYLWFEYIHLDIPEKVGPIDATFFEGANGSVIGTVDYKGEAFGQTINGVKVQSADYQPYFKFTASAIEQIKAYAAANGYTFLRIHSYANLYDNALIIGNVYTKTDEWMTTDFAIEDLDEEFLFWSQSQGKTEIYFWFEWIAMDIPDAIGPVSADFFEGVNGSTVSTIRFRGEAGGQVINGLKLLSSYYQPYFKFTSSAIEQIKAYAADNGMNTLVLHTYAILRDNSFIIGSTGTVPEVWSTTEISLEDLTEDFRFWSQSQGTTEIYFWFDYKNIVSNPYDQVIYSKSFTGSGVTFEDFQGEVAGENITGLKITSSSYQPHFKLTAKAVNEINAYASQNDVDTVIIHAYAILKDNAFVLNNKAWIGAKWTSVKFAVSDLTEEFDFWSQSQGTTEIYMWFEFTSSNPYNQTIHATSFTGSGVSFEDYQGKAGTDNITGIKVTSTVYQPHFSLTAAAVSEISEYAATNGYTTVTIHAYAILKDNSFVINNACWVGTGETKSLDVPVSSLTTSFDFWSQSQGTTEVYLWFEFK